MSKISKITELQNSKRLIPAIIILSSVLIFIANIYGMMVGVTNVFPHLFYLPIILAAYYYPRRGLIFAAGLSALYLGIVYSFFPSSADVIVSAILRIAVFILIALVVSFISGQLQREAEERSRLGRIIESSNDAVIGADLNEIITSWNAGAQNLYGYTPEEAVGKPITLIYPKERYGDFSIIRERIVKGETIHHFTTDRLTKENKRIHVSLSVSPIKGSDGVITGVSAIARDITEQTEAETALRKSEEKFRTLANFTYDWEYWISLDNSIVYTTPSCERITGYSADEFYSDQALIDNIVYPEDRARVTEHARLSFSSKSSSVVDFRITRKDGSISWIGHVCQPIYDAQGNYIGRRASNRDITERKKAEDLLRRNQHLLEDAMDQAQMVYWEYDIRSSEFTFNDRFYAFLGTDIQREGGYRMPAETFVQEFIHPDDRRIFSEIGEEVDRMKATDYTIQREHRIIRRNGEVRTVVVRVRVVRNTEGLPVEAHGSNQDITERKAAEAALQESEERYRKITEAVTDYIYTVKVENGRAVETHHGESCVSVTGYTSAEMAAKPDLWFTMVIEEDRQTVIDQVHRIMTGKEAPVVEHRIIKKDGTLRWVRNTPVLRHDAAGTFIAYDGLVQDITDQKNAEHALRESERRYRDFIELLPQMVFELDQNGRVLSTNRIANSLFGVSREDIEKGLSGFDLLIPQDRERALSNVQKIMKGELLGGVEYTGRRKDGKTFPIIVYSSPKIQDGIAIGTRGVVIDITDRKTMEEALQTANRKLNMLSSITRHDILNKLTGLRTYLELSKIRETNPDLLKYIEEEDNAADAIKRQIEFTRTYQDIGVNAPSWHDVASEIRSAAGQIGLSQAIKLDIETGDLEVYADDLIEKVFYNLMENSLRHGDHVTRIRFSYRRNENTATLLYEDNGAGISVEDKLKLFTRGYGKHTGLGLFLSREILSITGITIKETGETGRGVRFEMDMPAGKFRFRS